MRNLFLFDVSYPSQKRIMRSFPQLVKETDFSLIRYPSKVACSLGSPFFPRPKRAGTSWDEVVTPKRRGPVFSLGSTFFCPSRLPFSSSLKRIFLFSQKRPLDILHYEDLWLLPLASGVFFLLLLSCFGLFSPALRRVIRDRGEGCGLVSSLCGFSADASFALLLLLR